MSAVHCRSIQFESQSRLLQLTYNLFSICSSLAVAGGQDVRGATPSAAPRPGGRLNFAALPIRDDALPEGLEGLSAVGSAE